MQKYSRQREAIRACLCGRSDHPTADMIYHSLRQDYPNISLGTVYRNLNLLASNGEIRKISCSDSSEHFDARTDPHLHICCTRCGKVEDLPVENFPDLTALLSQGYGGLIESCTLHIDGVCAECRGKGKPGDNN